MEGGMPRVSTARIGSCEVEICSLEFMSGTTFNQTLIRLLRSSRSKSHSINGRKRYNTTKRVLEQVVRVHAKEVVKTILKVAKDQLKTGELQAFYTYLYTKSPCLLILQRPHQCDMPI